MHICNITKAFRVGGASAIGAMAYGTQTIPKVDVITGPGNIFVATAKKLVLWEDVKYRYELGQDLGGEFGRLIWPGIRLRLAGLASSNYLAIRNFGSSSKGFGTIGTQDWGKGSLILSLTLT